jgi:hypothetical protein
MSDEDLEVLVTIDDPSYGPDEDTFHHGTALPQKSEPDLDTVSTTSR